MDANITPELLGLGILIIAIRARILNPSKRAIGVRDDTLLGPGQQARPVTGDRRTMSMNTTTTSTPRSNAIARWLCLLRPLRRGDDKRLAYEGS